MHGQYNPLYETTKQGVEHCSCEYDLFEYLSIPRVGGEQVTKGMTKTKTHHIQQRLQLKSSDTCMVGISMVYLHHALEISPKPRLKYSMHGLFERKHSLHKINHHSPVHSTAPGH